MKDAVSFREIARMADLTPREVESFFAQMVLVLRQQGEVSIPGFGIIGVRTTPPRHVTKGATGPVDLPQVKWLSIRAAKPLRDEMKTWNEDPV